MRVIFEYAVHILEITEILLLFCLGKKVSWKQRFYLRRYYLRELISRNFSQWGEREWNSRFSTMCNSFTGKKSTFFTSNHRFYQRSYYLVDFTENFFECLMLFMYICIQMCAKKYEKNRHFSVKKSSVSSWIHGKFLIVMLMIAFNSTFPHCGNYGFFAKISSN